MSIIESFKGLFGQITHYKEGKYIGESLPGPFENSFNHYSADGSYCGYSSKGMSSVTDHFDSEGAYLGSSFDEQNGFIDHYDRSGYVASTHEDVISDHTYFMDADDMPFPDDFE